MTGGVIFIYDEHDTLQFRLNSSSVHAVGLSDEDEIAGLLF